MGATVATKNAGLDAMFGTGSRNISLHSGAPGETGANELSGGTPAYARKAVTFNAAASGQKTIQETNTTFDIPAGATVSYLGIWNGTTFLGSYKLQTELPYQTQGVYVLGSLTIPMT